MTCRSGSRPKPRFRPHLEQSEPRLLLSAGGLLRHLDAHPGVLVAEARAEHALVKLEGDAHAHALAGRLNSGGPSGKATPAVSQFFATGATFSFRFASPAQTGVINPGVTQYFNGFSLTVTPIGLNEGSGREVLKLDFQASTTLLKLAGSDTFTFGPFGSPTTIPVARPARGTGLFFYFTSNGSPVSGYKESKYFPDFKVSRAPLKPSPSAFSVKFDTRALDNFDFLFGPNRDGFTMNAKGFDYLGIPTSVTGMVIEFVVSPPK